MSKGGAVHPATFYRVIPFARATGRRAVRKMASSHTMIVISPNGNGSIGLNPGWPVFHWIQRVKASK